MLSMQGWPPNSGHADLTLATRIVMVANVQDTPLRLCRAWTLFRDQAVTCDVLVWPNELKNPKGSREVTSA